MTEHRERARQILANTGSGTTQEAIAHALLDVADAIREGHKAPVAEARGGEWSDIEDQVVLFVQQQPDRKALVWSGTMGTDSMSPEKADLVVLQTPVQQGGTGEDYLIYFNQGVQTLAARTRSLSGVRRHLLLQDFGTSVLMSAELAKRIIYPQGRSDV